MGNNRGGTKFKCIGMINFLAAPNYTEKRDCT